MKEYLNLNIDHRLEDDFHFERYVYQHFKMNIDINILISDNPTLNMLKLTSDHLNELQNELCPLIYRHTWNEHLLQ